MILVDQWQKHCTDLGGKKGGNCLGTVATCHDQVFSSALETFHLGLGLTARFPPSNRLFRAVYSESKTYKKTRHKLIKLSFAPLAPTDPALVPASAMADNEEENVATRAVAFHHDQEIEEKPRPKGRCGTIPVGRPLTRS
jgi:hypothetical protein